MDSERFRRLTEVFERACTLGSLVGCHNLGVAYQSGFGVKSDRHRAEEL